MFGVLILVYTISYLTPGDPVLQLVGANATPEQYAAKAAELNLDRGYFGQIGYYLYSIVTRLDFGKSYFSNLPVATELFARFKTTAYLGIFSLIIMVIVGIPLGIYSSVKQYSFLDYSLTVLALILAAIPSFVLALFGIYYFGVKLKWFPIAGLDTFKAWILPVMCNAIPSIAQIMRMTRTTMLEVIREDYIRTARSKGLQERVVIFKHALKNCLIPLLTVIGGSTAMVLSGSIIIENVFTIHGIGTYLYTGIVNRDYPIVNGCVLFIAFLVCMVNLIVDILYGFVDPRIKAQYQTPKRSKVKIAKESVA